MMIRNVLLSFVLFCISVNSGYCGNRWTSNGPYGGSIASFSFDPSNRKTIFSSTESGTVFRTLNSGDSWQRLNLADAGPSPFLIRIHPQNPDFILAAKLSIYASTDVGNSWQKLSEAFEPLDVVFDPKDGSVVYGIGTYYEGPGCCGKLGFFKSHDLAKTWVRVPMSGFPRGGWEDARIVLDPKNSGTIYVLWNQERIVKSSNGGRNWSTIFIRSGLNGNLSDLIIDTSHPQVLYAGGVAGIFRTDDGGRSWISTNCLCHVRSLALDPSDSQRILGVGAPNGEDGLETAVVSHDGGRNWQSLPLSSSYAYLAVAWHPQNRDEILVGSRYRGIFQSLDAGRSFHLINHHLDDLEIDRFVPDVKNPNRMLAATGDGSLLFETRDAAATWQFKKKLPLLLRDFRIHPLNSNLVLAAGCCRSAFAVSTDGGASWRSSNPLDWTSASIVAVDPTNQNVVYIAQGFQEGRIAKSTDLGRSWKKINSGLADRDITSLSMNASNVLIAGSATGRIFRSTNGGTSWSDGSQALPLQGPIDQIVSEPSDSMTVYAIVMTDLEYEITTIFRSMDGGHSWARMDHGIPVSGAGSLTIDPQNRRRLFVIGYQNIFS